jgi:hypothetical protein
MVDTSGYPYISYNTGGYLGNAYITQSSTNDGTWSTASGFPYNIESSMGEFYAPNIVRLSSGKMGFVWLWTTNSGDGYSDPTLDTCIKVKTYTGSSWNTTKESTYLAYIFGFYSRDCINIIEDGDNIHALASYADGYFDGDLGEWVTTDYNIRYIKYTYSGNSISTDTNAYTGVYYYPYSQIVTSTNNIRLYVWNSNALYYSTYNGSTWSSITSLSVTTYYSFSLVAHLCTNGNYAVKYSAIGTTSVALWDFIEITFIDSNIQWYAADGKLSQISGSNPRLAKVDADDKIIRYTAGSPVGGSTVFFWNSSDKKLQTDEP